MYVIRKRISIPADKAIFIFVSNTLPPTAALMSTVYEQHRDEDGFMKAADRRPLGRRSGVLLWEAGCSPRLASMPLPLLPLLTQPPHTPSAGT